MRQIFGVISPFTTSNYAHLVPGLSLVTPCDFVFFLKKWKDMKHAVWDIQPCCAESWEWHGVTDRDITCSPENGSYGRG